MRLSSFEKTIILSVFKQFAPRAQVLLCGSRVKDHARGGDIDLFVMVSSKEELNRIEMLREKILDQLYKHLGEQKIDLIFTTEPLAKAHPILSRMLQKAVRLREKVKTSF